MSLTLNNIVIESREDGFINATQLCKAGGKHFKDWYRLDSTKELINELETNLNCEVNINTSQNIKVIDVKRGNSKKFSQGSWVHPDLAVQLAQWISPSFAIQVSRWIRELLITGNVSVETNKTNEQLIELQNKVLQMEEERHRLNNIHKELLSYKKRVSKEETIYIVSTNRYATQGIFKIGRTKTKMILRNSSHNNTHIRGDKVKVIKSFQVNDSVLVERNIHTKLKGLILDGEKEFFMCPYYLLESLVDLIIHNDDNENDIVNKIIDIVYKLKQKVFDSQDWMQGVPPDFFKETLSIADGDEKLADLDVSKWNRQQKMEFVATCIKEYVKIENNANEQEFQIMWKNFQSFLIMQLSIPKSHFKATEWKSLVKDETEREKLSIKWKN